LPVDDEEEPRTRAPSSTSDGESGDPDTADGAPTDDAHEPSSSAPRKLDPPRPWLAQQIDGSSRDAPAKPRETTGDDGAQRLEPVRPWLEQNRPEPIAETKTPVAADRSRMLDPNRPWLNRPAPPPATPTASPTPSNPASVLEPLAAGIGAAANGAPTTGRRRIFGHRTVPTEEAVPTEHAVPTEEAAAREQPPHPSAAIAASDDAPYVRPAGRLRTATRWLFEQAPARPEDPAAAPAGDTVDAVTPAVAEDHEPSWSVPELSSLASHDEPTPAAESEVAAENEPEALEEPVSLARTSPRSDLARRLSALSPEDSVEPTIVALPSGVPMRPTIAWDELKPPKAPEEPAIEESVNEPGQPEPSVEPAAADEPSTPGQTPEPVAAEIEAEPESVPEAEPAPEPEPVHPRARPRPYASAPIRTDEPAAATPVQPTVPHGVTKGIAASAASSSPTRARTPEKDDFFTRPDEDDDEPRTESEKLVKGGPPGTRRSIRWLIRTGVILAIAVLAAVLLRVYVVAPYYIPSASMEPTLHGCSGCNNDHVLVDKLSYRMHDIHRGDVVVFHRPGTWQVPEKTLIKRVIGLPGDKLRVSGGKLLVNGLVLEESYTNPKCGPTSSASGNLAGAKTFGPVPAGEVYVMGDNRCNSSDSRAFGPVPDSKVIGRAFVIIWPLGRIHYL
jgi:signal peptidase I